MFHYNILVKSWKRHNTQDKETLHCISVGIVENCKEETAKKHGTFHYHFHDENCTKSSTYIKAVSLTNEKQGSTALYFVQIVQNFSI